MCDILIKFGDLELTAVLANRRTSCAMHTQVYEKICAKFSGYKTITKSEKIVGMIVTIDGFPVLLKMRLVSNLHVDVALGMDFLGPVKAYICCAPCGDGVDGTLTWYWYGERIVTKMLPMDSSVRPISGVNDPPNLCCIDLKYVTGDSGSEYEDEDSHDSATSTTHSDVAGATTTPTTENSRNEQLSKKSRKKRSKKRNKKSNNLKQDMNKGTSVSEGKSQNDDSIPWRTVYIVHCYLVDSLSGDELAYYGVRWGSKNKNNRITGELLKKKEKTMLGVLFDALSYVFEKATGMGIRNLHIVLENEDVIKFMTHYKNRGLDKEKAEAMKPDGLVHYYDIMNFSIACMGSDDFDHIKYEYVPFDDVSYRDMVILRDLIDDYIENAPL